MKKITSIFLCILLMMSLCTFSASAEESIENLFTTSKVVTFAHSDTTDANNSYNKSAQMITNLSASGDGLTADFRQTYTRTYMSDAFFAVELNQIYNLTGVEVIYSDSNKAIINNYRVFVTESKAFFDEAKATPNRLGLTEKGEIQYNYGGVAVTETMFPGKDRSL